MNFIHTCPGFVLAAALTLLCETATALPCGVPEVVASFPPGGSSAVPQNATLTASYGAPIDFDDESVVLEGPLGAVELDVLHDEAENTLGATPRAPLAAGRYTLVWPALRGVGTGRGRAFSLAFEVDAGIDSEPPSFDGLTGVTWDLSREDDPCTDALTDRLVFDLSFGAARDDRDTSLLQALVFETERPGEPSPPPLPIVFGGFPADGTLRVKRPAGDEGRRCFAAVVVDLTGSTSGGGEREVCVETRHGPFFEGCSLAVGARGEGVFVPAVILFGIWGARRRGRGAARARSG